MSDCVLATGATDSHGYGRVWNGRRSIGAHRVAWKRKRGPIPDGLHIDHLCKNRRCVNVEHMELVTPKENVLRGDGITAKNKQKTHCKWGHEFTPENTGKASKSGRQCKTCLRQRSAARRKK